MKFRLEFDCDNAAFCHPEDGKHYTETRHNEIVRILTKLAVTMETGSILYPREAWPIRDSNGNTIGFVKLTGKA